MKALDLREKRFGRLVALEPTNYRMKRAWRCRCDCGNIVIVPTYQLPSGNKRSCGCLRIQDLSGKTFGELEVVKRGPDSLRNDGKKYITWECNCVCGRTKTIKAKSLKSGVDNCGCKTLSKLSISRRLPLGEAMRNRVVCSYKTNARKKGFEYSLSLNEAINLLVGDCHYCGCKPGTIGSHDKSYGSFVYNGIDRIDNDNGYVNGNVVTCCMTCNYKKGSMSYRDFLEWIKRVFVNRAEKWGCS